MPEKKISAPVSGVMYTGNGDFIEGVPARDLTPEEWQALDAQLRETALKLRLYRIVVGKNDPGESDL